MKVAMEGSSIESKAIDNELRYAMFFVEHNIPFAVSDHLLNLIKTFDPDSKVLKKMNVGRTKVSTIIKEVIGEHAAEELFSALRKNKFSIMIDESTDIGTIKNLVVICRRFDSEKNDVVDEFLTLLKVTDQTSDGIYNVLKNFFLENEIPYCQNLVGFAADGAAVMFGRNHSVMTLLKNDIPHLFTMRCICHSLALCASYACKKLPNEIEALLSEVYCYFKYSSLRTQALEGITELLEIPVRKLLKFQKLRWLSLESVVARFLHLYDPLVVYFQKIVNPGPDVIKIRQKLENGFTIIYLKFLNFILPVVNEVNVEFQSEHPKIHLLYGKMKKLFEDVAGCYLKESYVENTDIRVLQYKNPSNFVPLSDLDLGNAANNELKKLDQKKFRVNIEVFLKNCLNFYLELMDQLFERFPFGQPEVQLLNELSFIDLSNLRSIKHIALIPEYFGMDQNAVDREYRSLRREFKDSTHNSEKLWTIIENRKKSDGSYEFPLLLEIRNLINLFPHSSAACERGFSCINNNKTKSRNSLKNKTIQGLLRGKNLLKKKHCYQFRSKKSLISKYVAVRKAISKQRIAEKKVLIAKKAAAAKKKAEAEAAKK